MHKISFGAKECNTPPLKYDFTPLSCICAIWEYVCVYQRFFAVWTEAASPICGMWAGCYFLSAAHVLQSFCA